MRLGGGIGFQPAGLDPGEHLVVLGLHQPVAQPPEDRVLVGEIAIEGRRGQAGALADGVGGQLLEADPRPASRQPWPGQPRRCPAHALWVGCSLASSAMSGPAVFLAVAFGMAFLRSSSSELRALRRKRPIGLEPLARPRRVQEGDDHQGDQRQAHAQPDRRPRTSAPLTMNEAQRGPAPQPSRLAPGPAGRPGDSEVGLDRQRRR